VRRLRGCPIKTITGISRFDEDRFAWELSIRHKKFMCQLDLISRYSSGRRLLDIGAGPGYFVKVALDQGWSAEAIEISQEAVRHGRRIFGVQYVTLEGIEDSSLDVVTCHHVLEHLTEPASFLEVLWRKLKPGGLLVFHVPHQQPLTFAVRNGFRRLIAGGRAETFCSLYGDVHITGFTERSLKRFVERQGFATQFTHTVGMWSMFYDPFFLGNFIRDRAWGAMVRKAVRHLIETIGIPFGLGDWVVGYFRKSTSMTSQSDEPAQGQTRFMSK